jgi:hypothetical protein
MGPRPGGVVVLDPAGACHLGKALVSCFSLEALDVVTNQQLGRVGMHHTGPFATVAGASSDWSQGGDDGARGHSKIPVFVGAGRRHFRRVAAVWSYRSLQARS